MAASHGRRTVAIASSGIVVLGALSACGDAKAESTSVDSVHCKAGVACAGASVTSGSITLAVVSEASKSSQTVAAELVTDQRLHCPSGSQGGTTAIFSSTAPDSPKAATLTISGDEGRAVAAAHAAHRTYLGCFGSPQPFAGYVDGRRNTAVFVKEDRLYEAALLPCGSVATTPCFRYSESDGTVTVVVQAPAGDPKIVPW